MGLLTHTLAVDLFFPCLLQMLGKILQTGLQHQTLYISDLTSLDNSNSELFMGFYFLCPPITITLLLNLPLNWASWI